jgi:hypothetical protein
MIGLTAAELEQMRNSIAELLPDTCDLLSATRTSDGAGGWSDTWGTVSGGSALPCRLDFRDPGKEAISNASLTPYKTGVLSLAYDAPISTDCRVQIGGKQFNVTGENTNQSWLTVRQINVERVP